MFKNRNENLRHRKRRAGTTERAADWAAARRQHYVKRVGVTHPCLAEEGGGT